MSLEILRNILYITGVSCISLGQFSGIMSYAVNLLILVYMDI